MSSRWAEPFRSALALRLALWYFLFFAVSSLVLVGATYLLLARSLQAQDRDTISSMLDRLAIEDGDGFEFGCQSLGQRGLADADGAFDCEVMKGHAWASILQERRGTPPDLPGPFGAPRTLCEVQ